jgi:hypothetical protein
VHAWAACHRLSIVGLSGFGIDFGIGLASRSPEYKTRARRWRFSATRLAPQ